MENMEGVVTREVVRRTIEKGIRRITTIVRKDGVEIRRIEETSAWKKGEEYGVKYNNTEDTRVIEGGKEVSRSYKAYDWLAPLFEIEWCHGIIVRTYFDCDTAGIDMEDVPSLFNKSR